MTVSELRKFLKNFDPQTQIKIFVPDDEMTFDLTVATKVDENFFLCDEEGGGPEYAASLGINKNDAVIVAHRACGVCESLNHD